MCLVSTDIDLNTDSYKSSLKKRMDGKWMNSSEIIWIEKSDADKRDEKINQILK